MHRLGRFGRRARRSGRSREGAPRSACRRASAGAGGAGSLSGCERLLSRHQAPRLPVPGTAARGAAVKPSLLPLQRAVVGALLGAAAAVVAAQDSPHPPADPVRAAYDRADTDRDGRLSRAEAARLPTVGSKFEQYDENRDGYLSFEEYRTGFPVTVSRPGA
ncbi:hypothetical protein CKO43_02335 [Rubrivivax gelatinosus]|uniref:EF-hand domain-containing protein n=1 Tax=Rubrivivax gelatinosus TaxID=28068 RepID=A0ABS1DR30_RUBGE|nr:hypothetical protein [Rubrivivax gelatinosus]